MHLRTGTKDALYMYVDYGYTDVSLEVITQTCNVQYTYDAQYTYIPEQVRDFHIELSFFFIPGIRIAEFNTACDFEQYWRASFKKLFSILCCMRLRAVVLICPYEDQCSVASGNWLYELTSSDCAQLRRKVHYGATPVCVDLQWNWQLHLRHWCVDLQHQVCKMK